MDKIKNTMEELEEMNLTDIEIAISSQGLQHALLRMPELIQWKYQKYLEQKQKVAKFKRELDQMKGGVYADLSSPENRKTYPNAESREGALMMDKGYKMARELYDDALIEEDRLLQVVWQQRNFQTNLLLLGELKLQELKSLGA